MSSMKLHTPLPPFQHSQFILASSVLCNSSVHIAKGGGDLVLPFYIGAVYTQTLAQIKEDTSRFEHVQDKRETRQETAK